MAKFSQTTNHCHLGKQTTLFGPRTADWNPTYANRATSHPFLATKTPNAVYTDDNITKDVNHHDTVDFGHETSLQVPRPPPQPPPLPWPALLSQHRVFQLGYQTVDGFTGDAARFNTFNGDYETTTQFYIIPDGGSGTTPNPPSDARQATHAPPPPPQPLPPPPPQPPPHIPFPPWRS